MLGVPRHCHYCGVSDMVSLTCYSIVFQLLNCFPATLPVYPGRALVKGWVASTGEVLPRADLVQWPRDNRNLNYFTQKFCWLAIGIL